MNIVTVYTALKFSYFTKEKVFGGPNEMTEQVRDFGVQTWGPKFKCLLFIPFDWVHVLEELPPKLKAHKWLLNSSFESGHQAGGPLCSCGNFSPAVPSSDTERTCHDSVYHWSSTVMEILPQNTWDVVGTGSCCVWKAFWSSFLLSYSIWVWKNNTAPPLLFLARWHSSVLTSISEVDWTIQNPTPAHLGCWDNSELNRCLLWPRWKRLEKFRDLASALIDS